MTPRHDDKSEDLYAALAGMGFVALIITITIVSMLHLEDALGPRIRDMISSDPATKIASDTEIRITVTPVGDPGAVRCSLDVRSMLASGGSLAIEATWPKPNPSYLVHWAGGRTSSGLTDCGTSAEFLLSPANLVNLKLAAGH
jgi:hypothetical protein